MHLPSHNQANTWIAEHLVSLVWPCHLCTWWLSLLALTIGDSTVERLSLISFVKQSLKEYWKHSEEWELRGKKLTDYFKLHKFREEHIIAKPKQLSSFYFDCKCCFNGAGSGITLLLFPLLWNWDLRGHVDPRVAGGLSTVVICNVKTKEEKLQ